MNKKPEVDISLICLRCNKYTLKQCKGKFKEKVSKDQQAIRDE